MVTPDPGGAKILRRGRRGTAGKYGGLADMNIAIREARTEDFEFVVSMITGALDPYYGGDHRAHAKRIFRTHISGGRDNIGFFSLEQKMFIAELDGERCGLLHMVTKRQETAKISPLIVKEKFKKRYGVGTALLSFAEHYARESGMK